MSSHKVEDNPLLGCFRNIPDYANISSSHGISCIFWSLDHKAALQLIEWIQKVAKETYSPIISFNQFVQQAPVIVVIVIEKPKLLSQIGGRIKDKDFYLIDIGITAEHFCLQAAEEGLGTCMLGWFNEKNIINILGVPSKKRIGLLITLGYADDEQRKKSRKEIEGMRSYNHY